MRFILPVLAILATPAVAWDGTDTSTGSSVEIDKGQLVRPGRSIDVEDSEDGLKTYDVLSIRRIGPTVEVEVFDPDSGDIKTLDMDD